MQRCRSKVVDDPSLLLFDFIEFRLFCIIVGLKLHVVPLASGVEAFL